MDPHHQDNYSAAGKNGAPDGVRGASGQWRGMIFANLSFAVAVAVLLFIYGTGIYGPGSLLMTALGLQALMAVITAMLTVHAGFIRKKIVETLEWKRPEWGENAENPYQIEVDQAKIIHFFVLGMIPTVLVAGLALYVLFRWTAPPEKVLLIPPSHATLIAILTMVGCILWLMIARAYDAVKEEDPEENSLPEVNALAEAAWESCWWMGLVAVGLVLKIIWPATEIYLAWAILIWILAVAAEQLSRLILGWIQAKNVKNQFTSPVTVFLRYMIFVRGNPIHSIFYTMEKKWGVSFRSSWAIRFVARATVPALLMVLLLWWGLSGLSVVRINEMGVRRDFGRLYPEPLEPGLHCKWPYPFGSITTYPVKDIQQIPVGFEPPKSGTVSYLWSHNQNVKEFELALGNGNEAIAIHAVVFYKIREDKEGFFQYALQFQNPQDAINNYAHHCLTELTRNSTLDNVLAMERDAFAARLSEGLQKYIDDDQIGVQIIDVALVGLHPPAKVADAYLDVISAKTDAQRVVTVARGAYDASAFRAMQDHNLRVTDAEVMKQQQVAQAHADTDDFVASGTAYQVNPDCFRLRYWLDNLQQILQNKNLAIIDESIDVYFDMQKSGTAENRNVITRAE